MARIAQGERVDVSGLEVRHRETDPDMYIYIYNNNMNRRRVWCQVLNCINQVNRDEQKGRGEGRENR